MPCSPTGDRWNRRRVLRTVVGTTAVALAGCRESGRTTPTDNGAEQTPTDTSRPSTTSEGGRLTDSPTPTASPTATTRDAITLGDEVDIDSLTLAASDPAGYGDVEAQPQSLFRMDTPVWMYYEPAGLTAELDPSSGAEGPFVAEFTEELRVTNEDDVTVMEAAETIRRPVGDRTELGRLFRARRIEQESLEAPDKIAIEGSTDFELRLQITDEATGATAATTESFTVGWPVEQTEGVFGVSNFAFCAAEPAGYGDFERQPDATYSLGEEIWIYFEVDGLSYRVGPGVKEVDLDADFVWATPDDDVFATGTATDRERKPADADLTEYFIDTLAWTDEDDATGTYSVRVILSDAIGPNRVEFEREFTVTA